MSFFKLKDAESNMRVIALLAAGVMFYMGWHMRILDFGRVMREPDEWRICGYGARDVLPHLTIPLGGLGILAIWYVLFGARRVARWAKVSLFTGLTFVVPALFFAFYVVTRVTISYWPPRVRY